MRQEHMSIGQIDKQGSTGLLRGVPYRAIVVCLLVWALVFAGEFLAQTAYYLKNGQGLFAALQNKQRYEYMPDGLKLLNPLASRPGFQINALGFRDTDVVMPKPAGLRRVAIVGGSTVMGEKAETNAARFSDILEDMFNARHPSQIDVVNVGVAGAQLRDIGAMIQYIVPKVQPDIIVIYPGGNDISQVCAVAPTDRRMHAPFPTLPAWWLSTTLLWNNTTSLRPTPPAVHKAGAKRLKIDIAEYSRRLRAIGELARADGRQVYLMTNARAFGGDQNPETLARLSAQFRLFASCFSPAELSEQFRIVNEEIRRAAAQGGFHLVDTGHLVPQDEHFFADSVHLSVSGEKTFAEILYDALSKDIFQEAARP